MAKQKMIYKAFSRWLQDKIFSRDLMIYPMARDLRIAPRTIYHHMKGDCNPTFAMVVLYCWYFCDGDDPLDIWKLVEEGESS